MAPLLILLLSHPTNIYLLYNYYEFILNFFKHILIQHRVIQHQTHIRNRLIQLRGLFYII